MSSTNSINLCLPIKIRILFVIRNVSLFGNGLLVDGEDQLFLVVANKLHDELRICAILLWRAFI